MSCRQPEASARQRRARSEGGCQLHYRVGQLLLRHGAIRYPQEDSLATLSVCRRWLLSRRRSSVWTGLKSSYSIQQDRGSEDRRSIPATQTWKLFRNRNRAAAFEAVFAHVRRLGVNGDQISGRSLPTSQASPDGFLESSSTSMDTLEHSTLPEPHEPQAGSRPRINTAVTIECFIMHTPFGERGATCQLGQCLRPTHLRSVLGRTTAVVRLLRTSIGRPQFWQVPVRLLCRPTPPSWQ